MLLGVIMYRRHGNSHSFLLCIVTRLLLNKENLSKKQDLNKSKKYLRKK